MRGGEAFVDLGKVVKLGKSVGIFDFYDWILGLGGMVRAL